MITFVHSPLNYLLPLPRADPSPSMGEPHQANIPIISDWKPFKAKLNLNQFKLGATQKFGGHQDSFIE